MLNEKKPLYYIMASASLFFLLIAKVDASSKALQAHSLLPPISGVVDPVHTHNHVPEVAAKLTVKRPPRQQTSEHVHVHEHSNSDQHQSITPQARGGSIASKEGEQCDPSRYAQSGDDLLNVIKQQSFDCVEMLFFEVPQNILHQSFTNNNIISVANEATEMALVYDGTDEDQYLIKLFYWIRAAYFFGNRSALTVANQNATLQAMKALFASANFYDLNEEHANLLDVAIANLNNALIAEHFVPELIALLQNYNESFEAVPLWGGVMANASWDILFACSRDELCRSQYHNIALITAISDFIQSNLDWLDTPYTDYHLFNLGYQLTNFYSGEHQPHFARVKAVLEEHLEEIFTDFGPYKGDTGRRAYLASLAGIIESGKCETFDLCGAPESITEKVLNNRMNCVADTLFIWAQDMNQEQMAWACSSLRTYEQRFHDSLKTESKPVTPDDNDRLRMVVFDDATEWDMYGYVLFGASTDNGGLYLEGDPSQPGDQATLFAYENVGERPVFDIWNLRHEYVHYLDGRFISHGDFFDVNGAGRTVWFGEGLAEYISKGTCNPHAAEQAAEGVYALSTIFDNEYDVGQNRIYRWGYLAVRYMFEQQHETFVEMIELFQTGRYQKYRTDMVDKWITEKRFDEDFAKWLTGVESSGCQVDGTRPVAPVDLEEIQGPDTVAVNACADERTSTGLDEISPGEALCLAPLENNDSHLLYILVPDELTSLGLQVTVRQGEGSSRLYHRFNEWPYSESDHSDESSVADKSLIIQPLQAGWNYFIVDAVPSLINATFLARFIHFDTDGDGLSDREESDWGTDPNVGDTDGDGLNDFDEVIIHNTNAHHRDSDGDGISDGDEIAQALNPLYNERCPGFLCGAKYRGWRVLYLEKKQ